ncbi:uncharacterized protein B0T15DRAFT_85165 [Chaetomium strumarium]|uniref:Yippee domain-containing protein n=1 Tax=Chaetomium strumarium TaxID=1170767 RepID=A0AAJ0M3M4_9PEZI|nr:hypothetical protein B0T15DRAFT_85165 [Chaetomium strumarium]
MLEEWSIFKKVGEPSENKPPSLLYILPTLRTPFRRRRTLEPPSPPPQTASEPELSSPASDDVPSLSSSPSSPASPGFPPASRLSCVRPTTLRCRACSADLAFHDQIISKNFIGRGGRGYLVAPPSDQPTPSCPRSPPGTSGYRLVNILIGTSEQRRLTTGPHVVADISCAGCGAMVGWKYIDARNPEQKYKVGMFILETARVVRFHSWEDVEDVSAADDGHAELWDAERADKDRGVPLPEFDSEDEDECDELFAGTWDPKMALVSRVLKKHRGVDYEEAP